MTQPRVVQINVSNGGVPKKPIREARVGLLGVDGDAHRDTKNHGGPERALCLFSLEVIDSLRAEGHPIAPGTVGENLTIAGLDWGSVLPGRRYRLGDVEIEITGYTTPCKNIQESFAEKQFVRISQTRHPQQSRVYARVLKEGTISEGAPVEEIA